MYRYEKWETVTNRALRRRVLKRVSETYPRLPEPGRTTRTQFKTFSFYPGGQLVRATDRRWPDGLTLYYLCFGDQALTLEGRSPPIHEANSEVPIALTSDNVAEYVGFFGFFVRGEEGAFHVLTGRSDPFWPKTLPDETQQKMEDMIKSYEQHPAPGEDGRWPLKAMIQYGLNCFVADFAVDASGSVEMIDDHPLPWSCHTAIDAPLKPSGRFSRGRAEKSRKTAGVQATEPPADEDDDGPFRLPTAEEIDVLVENGLLEDDPNAATTESADNDGSGKSAPPPTPPPDEESVRKASLEGMQQARDQFSGKHEARHVRDFAYHWSVVREPREDKDPLPEQLARQVDHVMGALIEDATSDPSYTGAKVRVLKQLNALDGSKSEERDRYKPLMEAKALRTCAHPEEFARQMLDGAPHMAAAIRQITSLLRVGLRIQGDGRVRLPPILFVGPPGGGKSWAAQTICQKLDLPFLTLNAGGASDARFLTGTSRGWSSAAPSAMVDLLLRSEVANPALIIEEIEKSGGSDHNGRLHHALLTLLEPATARTWVDECIGEPVDVSHINWFATANDIGAIPRALVNRMMVIRIERPSVTDVVKLIDVVADEIAESYGASRPGRESLTEADREAITRTVETEALGIRDLRRVVLEVLGSAPPHLRIVD
ncbi:MAG: AAA family ATPase [Hyphomonadaceae bacterium]